MEENNKAFTLEELERMKKTWGEPPACCTGNCDIRQGFLISCCNGCPWDDWGRYSE